MRTLIKIAWRNIWRNKMRSLVVIFAITSGLVGGLFASAWLNGMAKQRVQNTFLTEAAHIEIHRPEYLENLDIKKTIRNTGLLVQLISGKPEVVAVTDRIAISAMAATAGKNTGVTVLGIHPEKEKKVFGLYQKIKPGNGSFFSSKKKNTIVISKALATELKVRLGSKIILTFQDYNGAITGGAFKVAGIFKTNNTPWDKTHVFVKMKDLRKLAAIPEGESHEIDIRLTDFNLAQNFAVQLQKNMPRLLVQDWTQTQPYLNFVTQFMDIMMGIFMLIILGALGFGIVNTMLMVILERTKELGMLMAIGMNKKRLFITIMLETIFLALVGGIIGELISMLLIRYFGHTGIDLSSFAEGFESVGYSAISYPFLEFYRYVQITFLVILTGILVSIYPAIKALKLNPAEAIRTL